MKQLSDEWFAARVGQITGSRVAAILGHSPWQSRNQLMREMIEEWQGMPRKDKGNVATQWGNDHEAQARAAYEAETGWFIEEVGFCPHPDIDFIGASPDGLHVPDVAERVLEIKCPYSGNIPDEVPAHYNDQCQLIMNCIDVTSCDLYYWTEEKTRIFTIDYDPDWWAATLPEMNAFIEEFWSIRDDELTDEVVATVALDAADRLVMCRDKIKALQEVEKQCKEELMGYVNPDKETRIGKVLAVHAERKGTVNYKAMEKDGIDVEKYRGKPSTYVTFREAK